MLSFLGARKRSGTTNPDGGSGGSHIVRKEARSTSIGSGPSKSKGPYQLSKEVLDFDLGEGACPVNEMVKDTFIITNTTSTKVKFHFEPASMGHCKLIFDPSSGTIGAGAKNKGTKKIIAKLTLSNSEPVNFRVNLKITDKNNRTETLFLVVRTHTLHGMFGVDPSTLETVYDAGFDVPSILVEMKNYLLHQDAWQQEGIFRLAGEASDIKYLKQQMNKAKRLDVSTNPDINAIANLLKIWYRDLPTPILNELPAEAVCNSTDFQVCVDAYDTLKEPQRSLLGWLLDLMVDVCSHKSVNKMSEQNLAIVVAPNLYDPPGCDPMEGLVMSQKAVQFLHHLVLYEIERRAAAAAETHHHGAEDYGYDNTGEDYGQWQ